MKSFLLVLSIAAGLSIAATPPKKPPLRSASDAGVVFDAATCRKLPWLTACVALERKDGGR